MLKKLHSRHPVDVPAEGFGRSKGLLVTIGGLATVAVLIPLALAVLEPLSAYSNGVTTYVLLGAVSLVVLLVVLLFLSALGAKPGYRGGDSRGLRR